MDPLDNIILALLEEELYEAKHIGSYKGSRVDREVLAAGYRIFDPVTYKKELYTKARAGRESWKLTRNSFYDEAMKLCIDYKGGSVSFPAFKKQFYGLLKEAYFKSFTQGLHSVGMSEFSKFSVLTMIQTPSPDKELELTADEKHYIQFAWRHEVTGFLSKFIDDIAHDRLKMPLHRRLGMYADALWNIYQSGRFMGKPGNTLIYWNTRKDREVCPSCTYLGKHSPYLKTTLPTLPRAGLQKCLTFCRCVIVFKDIDTPGKLQLIAAAQKSKHTHLNNLRRIKRLGK